MQTNIGHVMVAVVVDGETVWHEEVVLAEGAHLLACVRIKGDNEVHSNFGRIGKVSVFVEGAATMAKYADTQ